MRLCSWHPTAVLAEKELDQTVQLAKPPLLSKRDEQHPERTVQAPTSATPRAWARFRSRSDQLGL